MTSRRIFSKVSCLGLRSHQLQRLCLRTFLTNSYKCETEWKGRLKSPLLIKLRNENLYVELLKKFSNEGKVSAIDVDLFSNLVVEKLHLDELIDITHKFRRCPNTVQALPSTGHAVIRTFLDFKETDTLMRLLDDRLNYGLFLDYYLSNLLMDAFIKEGNYRDAAKVAIQLMLQEEFDHPITSHLALYSCYAYLKNPQPETWDPQPIPKPEEPTEVVKVRVDYIREPFFDDHFDLTNPKQLIGKALVGFGKHIRSVQPADSVAHTSLLLGWTLFEKYDKVIECLDAMLKSNSKPFVYKEWLQFCQKSVSESSQLPENFLENFNSRISHLETDGYLVDGNVQDVIKERVTEAVKAHESADIREQVERYTNWERVREEQVQKQIEAIDHRKRLIVLEAKKKELLEKEERLTFFDNLDQWELREEEKEAERQLLAEQQAIRNKKVSSKMLRQAEEDAYFPPEIVVNSKRNT